MRAVRVASSLGCLALFACAGARQVLPDVPKAADVAHFEVQPTQEAAAAQEASVAPPLPTEAEVETPAPTWSAIYARYLGPGTEGGCGRSRACHAATMSDAPSAYSWLAQRGYIAGAQSPLVSATNSCLRWFGGNMPPRGGANDHATRDLV